MLDGLPLNRCSMIVGILALLVGSASIILFIQNQSLEAEVSQRQQFISQAVGMAQLNQGLVRALASAVVTNNDIAISDMLHAQGINITARGTVPNASPPAVPGDTTLPATGQ